MNRHSTFTPLYTTPLHITPLGTALNNVNFIKNPLLEDKTRQDKAQTSLSHNGTFKSAPGNQTK